MRRLALVVAVLSLGGCARDGVFDLDVALEPDPTGVRPWRLIEITDIDGIASSWDQLTFATASTRTVLVDDRTTLRFSVVSEREATEVSVRVRYCRTQSCSDSPISSEPGYRVTFQRSIWIGRRTQYTLVVGPPTEESVTVDQVCRCEVTGCNSGVPATPTSGICVGTADRCSTTATHPCDVH